MLRVGITGGIASGKSAAAAFWAARFGWPSCSADIICRDLLRKGGQGWLALIREFGPRFFNAAGHIDRPALRAAIFRDAACRRTVNRLLHPLAREAISEWMTAVSRKAWPSPVLLAEVPLLFEAGWQDDFDVTVSVYTSREQCLQRLCRRDGLAREDAEEALSTQLLPDSKALLAHHVIDNSGVWWETCLQLIHLASLFSGKKLDTCRVEKI